MFASLVHRFSGSRIQVLYVYDTLFQRGKSTATGLHRGDVPPTRERVVCMRGCFTWSVTVDYSIYAEVRGCSREQDRRGNASHNQHTMKKAISPPPHSFKSSTKKGVTPSSSGARGSPLPSLHRKCSLLQATQPCIPCSTFTCPR